MVQRRAAPFATVDYRTTSSVTRMLDALQWTNIFPTNYLQILKAIVVVYIQLKPACLIYGNCLEAVFESFQGGGSYDSSQ
jgi:hypothetical protein